MIALGTEFASAALVNVKGDLEEKTAQFDMLYMG